MGPKITLTLDDPGTPMTVAEAGRRGGRTTLKRHGKAHYSKAGKQGGATTAKRYGKAHFAEIGGRHRRRPDPDTDVV